MENITDKFIPNFVKLRSTLSNFCQELTKGIFLYKSFRTREIRQIKTYSAFCYVLMFVHQKTHKTNTSHYISPQNRSNYKLSQQTVLIFLWFFKLSFDST